MSCCDIKEKSIKSESNQKSDDCCISETLQCCEPVNTGCCVAKDVSTTEQETTLKIEGQRLIRDEETCPRCGSTEEELNEAVITLRKSLAPLGIEVVVEKRELSVDEFEKDPLESSCIWLNGQLLEDLIDANVGQSPCCDVCGPSECRTVLVNGHVYETIPSEVIVRAGLVAASKIMRARIKL